MRDYLGEQTYPCEDTLLLAGTGQIIGTTHTFSASVRFIIVNYTTHAIFIGKTAAVLASAADGTADGRHYVPAGGYNIVIPWTGKDVFFVNAVGGETPTTYVTGIA